MHAATIGTGKSGPALRLLGGHFRFDDVNSMLRRSLLPGIVEVPSQAQDAARLRGVLESIGDEAGSDRPGRALVLDRLLELLLVEVIRNAGLHGSASHQGLLAGLADQRIAAALGALHADIRKCWTIARLADIAGMSRSAFAERFGRTVGLPPIDYLSQWRAHGDRPGHAALRRLSSCRGCLCLRLSIGQRVQYRVRANGRLPAVALQIAGSFQ